jgi:hypothetical protein
MATYTARMMDAETGGEGKYTFQGPDDLMKRTADEIVAAFFESATDILSKHADWELNGVLKNRERGVVTAIGSLVPDKGEELPFLLMISKA